MSSHQIQLGVVRCSFCNLNQYRTHDEKCRRCLKFLPSVIREPVEIRKPTVVTSKRSFTPPECVENLAKRILFLRTEVLGSTQKNFGYGSRSYLSRIESGKMKPSIGWLESFSNAVGIPLKIILTPDFTEFSITYNQLVRQILLLSREFKFTHNMWLRVIELVRKAAEFRTTERVVNQIYREQLEVKAWIQKSSKRFGGQKRGS